MTHLTMILNYFQVRPGISMLGAAIRKLFQHVLPLDVPFRSSYSQLTLDAGPASYDLVGNVTLKEKHDVFPVFGDRFSTPSCDTNTGSQELNLGDPTLHVGPHESPTCPQENVHSDAYSHQANMTRTFFSANSTDLGSTKKYL